MKHTKAQISSYCYQRWLKARGNRGRELFWINAMARLDPKTSPERAVD